MIAARVVRKGMLRGPDLPHLALKEPDAEVVVPGDNQCDSSDHDGGVKDDLFGCHLGGHLQFGDEVVDCAVLTAGEDFQMIG